jgi:hypothetical protein
MSFHFKPPTTCQPTASPEQALCEEKRKLPFLDMLNRDLKRVATLCFGDLKRVASHYCPVVDVFALRNSL